MHAKPLLLLRLTGSNSEKKSKTVAHCGKTRHHREPATNTHKKKKIRCNCTFTPTGGHSTRGKNKWFEQWIQSWRDKVHWNDSFWQNYCHLEDLGKKMIWNSPNFDLIPPPMMVQDGEEWSSGSTLLSKTKRVKWKKKWDSLYVYFSCVLFML